MRNRTWLYTCVAACLVTTSALAVKPGEWLHQTEADFQAAELDHTVVTNLGRVELSRASDKLAELPDDQTIIYDLARTADGKTYLAIGPTGRLGHLDDEGKIQTLIEYKQEQIFALLADGTALWVAVSGAKSRLDKIVDGQIAQSIELKETRYVWDMLLYDGKLWVATGTEGKVFHIDPAGGEEIAPAIALDAGPKNVLCLGIDGKGQVYAGTDGEGLVFRITPQADIEKPYATYVMYDATEPEIGALLVRPDGTVFAGTADAQQARPGRLAEAIAEEKGTTESPDDEGDGGGDDGDDGGDDGQPQPPDDPGQQPKPDPVPGDGDGADGQQAQPVVPAKPTARQYTALRKEVAKRLAEARKGKPLQAGPGGGNRSAGLRPRRPSGGAGGGNQAKEGNAVYQISTDGFVREVFRETVMVLSMAEGDGKLYITTGNEGQVYRVDPGSEEITVLADLEVQQVPAMMFDDGKVLIGTANPGRIVRLGSGFAPTGTFTSDPLDASQPSMFGAMQVQADLPEGTKVSVQTRSGNVGDPEQGHWSDWTEAQLIAPPAAGMPVYVKVQSPTARFLQYKLTLESAGDASPAVSKIAMKYLLPNMRPKINSLKAAYPENNGNNGLPVAVKMNIEWEAADADGDQLQFKLETKRLGTDQPYIELEDEITANNYEWDTRAMPDGRYLIRLTASDVKDNVPGQVRTAARVSAPVLVDNSSPAIGNIEAGKGEKPDQVTIKATAQDELSVIADFRYSLNGKKDWNAVLPADMIYDSTSEQMSFTIPDLSPGTHVITLRAADAMGNVRYASVTAKVAE